MLNHIVANRINYRDDAGLATMVIPELSRIDKEGEKDMTNMVRIETEGTKEQHTKPHILSFLSVNKRLFGRLQEEMTQAQSKLKLKEEQVLKLPRTRHGVQRVHYIVEYRDVTTSKHKLLYRESKMDRWRLASDMTPLCLLETERARRGHTQSSLYTFSYLPLE